MSSVEPVAVPDEMYLNFGVVIILYVASNVLLCLTSFGEARSVIEFIVNEFRVEDGT